MLNHQLLSFIIAKAGFDNKVTQFFSNYLTNRFTQYIWNQFTLPLFNTDVRVGQGSSLSPILSALYVAPLFYIFEKRTMTLFIPVSLLSFVDDSLSVSQEKSYEKSNSILQSSYSIISSLFENFGFVIEHDKSEVFHFSRATKKSKLPLLDLSPADGPILNLKDIWQYLGFFFDKKLSFRYHTYYYANKVISTIKSIKMLGNSTRGLSPVHKHLLYRTYVLPITLYGLQLWYFKGASIFYPLKELKKMQQRTALWITGAFCISLT